MDDRISNLIYAVIPAAALYFAGIIYLSEYLSQFGVSIHEINIDTPIILSYSANVFLGAVFISGFITICCAIALLHYSYFFESVLPWPKSFVKSTVGRSLGVAVITLGVFALISLSAVTEARRSAEVSWKRPMSGVIPREFDFYNYILSDFDKEVFKYCIEKRSFQYVFATEDDTYFLCRDIHDSGIALLIEQHKTNGEIGVVRSIDEKW